MQQQKCISFGHHLDIKPASLIVVKLRSHQKTKMQGPGFDFAILPMSSISWEYNTPCVCVHVSISFNSPRNVLSISQTFAEVFTDTESIWHKCYAVLDWKGKKELKISPIHYSRNFLPVFVTCPNASYQQKNIFIHTDNVFSIPPTKILLLFPWGWTSR